MKVGFYSPHLCVRGTTVAMFDYAFYNQKILGNESVIFYDKENKFNHKSVLDKFSIFQCVPIGSVKDLDLNISHTKCDAIYIIKAGWRDERMATACKTLIQAVGCAPPTEAHGDVYAYGSYWLAKHCSNNELPAVPHMVDLPNLDEDLREYLKIPKSATVFGRNGGLDTWNLPFANKAVYDVLNKRKDVYFLFQNTPINFTHERILHLPTTADMRLKTKFINTCDAMIHARHEGESFGLSCAEFSVRNKPIVTWAGSPERNHIETLGEKGIYYSNGDEMVFQLSNFEKRPDLDWNCYRDYSPEKIIKIFEKVYLK